MQWHDGSPVAPSPRQVLNAQLERAKALGFDAAFGSELEFFLFRESYEEAHAKHYRDLTPSVPYILDYHILGAGYDEPFMRAIRTAMKAAGMQVESSKGEAWPGQHEINFRYAMGAKAADDHVVYKTGAKELAHQCGMSLTFMAKPDHTRRRLVVPHPLVAVARRRVGVRRRDGHLQALPRRARSRSRPSSRSSSRRRSTRTSASPRAAGRRRRSPGATTTARAASASSATARRCARRRASRAPTRIRISPSRALLASGLYGIEQQLELGPAFEGNAYESDVERFPHTLREAIARLENGTIARTLLGDEVIDHYLNYARTEQRLFDEVVTCYERERMFERG